MSARRHTRSTAAQRGQAMTEFLIACAFVLLPLFIFIPLLGKYIDFKHSAIQSARYQAWEYTVWYNDIDDRDLLDNFNTGIPSFRIPSKTLAETQQEALIRTMGTDGRFDATGGGAPPNGAVRPIRSSDAFATYERNLLWRDNHQRPIFDGAADMDFGAVETDDDTPTVNIFGVNVGAWLNTILDVVQIGFDAVAAIINFIDSFSRNNQGDGSVLPGADEPFAASAGFSAINNDAYSHVEFDAMAAVYNNIIGTRTRLNQGTGATNQVDVPFSAKAGVLADGWNAGGTAHTYLQVNGATPSTLVFELLNLPGLAEIWDLISLIAPELSACDANGKNGPPDPLIRSPLASEYGHLWLGYVDGDVVHPDRLGAPDDPDTPLGSHVCDDSGRCIWDADVQALDPVLSHSPCRDQ